MFVFSPLDQHAQIQVHMSVHSVGRVVTHRHTHTHTQMDDLKTITTIADAGCKNGWFLKVTLPYDG